ncbi:MAG: glutamate synthase-related protein [Legionella sp.]|uniref:glutamate synthase-related protein n=1 Tax=Legionella sp. TaxID=459 RepID=UPI0039E70F67
MIAQTNESFIDLSPRDSHSACGVGLLVHFSPKGGFISSHSLVEEGLKILAGLSYRAGYNLATQESDGSGIRLYGLPTQFFNKLLKRREFIGNELPSHLILKEKHYALGQFFMPKESEQQAKVLIESCAQILGLKIIAWRSLEKAMNCSVLSASAQAKKPAIWQAIILTATTKPKLLQESKLIELSQNIYNQEHKEQTSLQIVSLSSEKIVYKGMIPAPLFSEVYQDLQDHDFCAYACDHHTRFATNTSCQWSNAQPCPYFISHNGELNSALSNAHQMAHELHAYGSNGIYPNNKLSDSMQFDIDVANQIMLKQIPLEEAIIRLMAPDIEEYPAEIKAMLRYWSLERTPYNGPAFMVAGASGYFIAKLDNMGLRPSRWALVEDEQGNRHLHCASDDFIDQQQVIQKGHLEPGGMLMLTPQGELLQTREILQRIAKRYHQNTPNYFQEQFQKKMLHFANEELRLPLEDYLQTPTGPTLQRILYASGWDFEAEDQVVRFMAENGYERTGAMGDDTNVLYTYSMPPHCSYFFHQLFAQVSAPPLDSIKERERFSLKIFIGGNLHPTINTPFIELDSPILKIAQLKHLEQCPIHSQVIDLSFDATQLTQALPGILQQVAKAVHQKQITLLILSDKNAGAKRAALPDLIAVAAVRKYLEKHHLDFNVSIVIDSYQIHGPHQASTLLALGAKALYPRGAYAKIKELFPKDIEFYCENYREALQKCLLKTMGKMGITDVNNYINSSLVGALGLDLSHTEQKPHNHLSLSNIFAKIYSPLKGIGLEQIMEAALIRYQQAHNTQHEFALLPRSGYYMPEKEGIKHGFGPAIINAFTVWMNEENVRATLYQIYLLLHAKGYSDFITDPHAYSAEQGFLDPRFKNAEGFYPVDYLACFKPSAAFKKLSQIAENYRRENPTTLRDYFIIKSDRQTLNDLSQLQSTEEIRNLLYSGSMSQGALTVADPKTPHRLGAHETLTRGINAVGAKSASGEGGEALQDLRQSISSTRSKQFASGRFGVSAEQMLHAEEIEIKIAQGAKPGEGGELPGNKVSIRFAAQRGGMPHLGFISPPPHHDIYSIEDLAQLIYDIKTVNPKVKVAVKLVASQGIGAIAVGVAKAGADVINIAANSGGTGAAQQSSIKHAGFPGELGLAEVDRALRQLQLRDFVQLRVSGGFKTAEDILIAAILGADLFEVGSTAMLTLGCKMQRTCNLSCQPGVATDGHLFKGDQINTERYFVNLAAAIQERLIELGYQNLHELRSRTDLLHLITPKLRAFYDFSAILDRGNLPPLLTKQKKAQVWHARQQTLTRNKEDELLKSIQSKLQHQVKDIDCAPIHLCPQDRCFGARIVGATLDYLQNNPNCKITINTTGNAGQSYGFVNTLILKHVGTVQDGCAKSMTSGELILCSASMQSNTHTIAGNAILYGASGGKAYINGRVGHRFAILLKGAEVVVEEVGDFAFEYMTSGTALLLGKAGRGLGTGALGGIIFAYDRDNSLNTSTFVRIVTSQERLPYQQAIQALLNEHKEKTHSTLAAKISKHFNLNDFKVLIPVEMDKITHWHQILDIIQTYRLRNALLTRGMEVWLTQKILNTPSASKTELQEFYELIKDETSLIFSPETKELLQKVHSHSSGIEYRIPLIALKRTLEPKPINPIRERLKDICGVPDHQILHPLRNIQAYVHELAQNAQGCSGCRSQSCAGDEKINSGCPSGKGINTINNLLKKIGTINEADILSTSQWNYLRQAFAVQIHESPFIAYTGAACPAPCQDACTETIPNLNAAVAQREDKLIGEHVHIKDIEYDLYLIGRALRWFDGKKNWDKAEIAHVFGGDLHKKELYEQVMQQFKPPFAIPAPKQRINKELIIIGSGPAGMQMAYKALLDGVQVRMYEQSDKPGGLLADGIPAHKFDKQYLNEDFQYLQAMGLELHLNSKVIYNEQNGDYLINASKQIIANSHNEHQFIALCIGSGKPKFFSESVITELNEQGRQKLIQATDFLRAANMIAKLLNKNPAISNNDKEALIQKHLGIMDPRNKKIVVVGGGDTAQDVIRWLTRYFNQEQNHLNELNILVRGYQHSQRGIMDAYPMPSLAPTDENLLKKTEIELVHGTEYFLVEPVKINTHRNTDKLTLQMKQSRFKYAEQILKDSTLSSLFDVLPREHKPVDPNQIELLQIDEVDLIICALGFENTDKIPIVSAIERYQLKNVYRAGDAAGTRIIVAAQNNANKIYSLIRSAMGISGKSSSTTQAVLYKAPFNE